MRQEQAHADLRAPSVRRAPGFGETVLSRLQWALEQTKPINNPYALLAFFFLALIGIVTLIPSGVGAILAAVAVLAMLLYGSRSLAAPAAKTWAVVMDVSPKSALLRNRSYGVPPGVWQVATPICTVPFGPAGERPHPHLFPNVGGFDP
jgi:hypothetical protein